MDIRSSMNQGFGKDCPAGRKAICQATGLASGRGRDLCVAVSLEARVMRGSSAQPDRVHQSVDRSPVGALAESWRKERMTRKPSLRQTVGYGQGKIPVTRVGNGTYLWSLAAAAFAMSVSLSVEAAGPKAGELYAGFGGGLFTPEFNLKDSNQSSIAPNVQQQNIAVPRIGIGPIGFRLPVTITAGNDRAQQSDDPENRGVISLNGGLGYQITDHFGIEGGLGLTLPRILLEGPIVSRVISNDPETISIKIAAPAVIPIHLSAIYTFIPDNIVSPFIGAGMLFADLSNRISFNEASDTIGAEGGFEVGYVLDAGARFRVNERWYGTVGLRYGLIDEPELKDDLGNKIAIEDMEIREIRFGLGMTFPGSILPFVAGGS